MSGLEVVGLVLGIIPIVISAASAYRAALDPFLTILQPKLRDIKLADFYRDFLFEVCILQEILKTVFDRIPKSRRQRSDSVIDEASYRDILAENLGDTHPAFSEILLSNATTLNHIISEKGLSLPADDPVVCESRSIGVSYVYPFRRLQSSMPDSSLFARNNFGEGA